MGRALVVAPHKPVVRMRPLDGIPKIRAWWNADNGTWEALEGSHRLAMAMYYDMPVRIIPVNLIDVLPNHNMDGSNVVGDDARQTISVEQALEMYRNYPEPRPVYELTVKVRK